MKICIQKQFGLGRRVSKSGDCCGRFHDSERFSLLGYAGGTPEYL